MRMLGSFTWKLWVLAAVLGACSEGTVSPRQGSTTDVPQPTEVSTAETDMEPSSVDTAGDHDTAISLDTVAQDGSSASEDVSAAEDSQLPSDVTLLADLGPSTDGVQMEDTPVLDDSNTIEDAGPNEDAAQPGPDALEQGSVPTSCGATNQGLTAVDCTAYGDQGAACVFSHHCKCDMGNGFVCEGWQEGDGAECAPGLVCVPKTPPVDPKDIGHVATSCGSPGQGLTPIDCTQYGDKNAFCVFSNHCACSTDEGFACETPGQWGEQECDPGVYCKPAQAP